MPRSSPDQRMRGLGVVREVAVQRAVDPVSFEDLRARPDQIGALVYQGRRVEPALYHRTSVVDRQGELCVRDGLSPVTGELVNGFQLAPALCEVQELAEFLDWDGDGVLSLTEVSTALAAFLPVDEERVEHFLRDNFNVDASGTVDEEELVEKILPYCSARLGDLMNAAPLARVPELWRGSSHEALSAWFDHWHPSGSSEIDLRDLRFAVTSALYRACGDQMDFVTKETMVSLFLAEAQLLGEGGLTCDAFVELAAPALQANLPQRPQSLGDDPQGSDGGVVQQAKAPLRLAIHAPFAKEEDGTYLTLEASRDDSAGDLLGQAAERWGDARSLQLYLDGQPLAVDPRVKLCEVSGLRDGAVLQALPLGGVGSKCVVA